MPLSENRAYRNASGGGGGGGWRRNPFVLFLGGLVALWILVTVLGAVVRGLFFLTVLGVIFLIVTAAVGAFKLGRRD